MFNSGKFPIRRGQRHFFASALVICLDAFWPLRLNVLRWRLYKAVNQSSS
jgi:hypothetical protein